MAQLSQRLGFDLPNSFAGHCEVLPHFFEGVLGAGCAETKSHLNYFLFTRCKCGQYFVGNFPQV